MAFRPYHPPAPPASGLTVSWAAVPASGAARGGDRLFVGDDGVSFLVADVMGNGPPAADTADFLAAAFLADPGVDGLAPADLLAVLHSRLVGYFLGIGADADFWFVDALAVRFDSVGGAVEAAGSGGVAAWVGGPDGWARWGFPTGPLVGLHYDGREPYPNARRPFPPGGRLVAVTDGVPDAAADDRRFGADGVAAALADSGPTAGDAVAAVMAALNRFAGSGLRSDAAAFAVGR